MRRHLAEQWQCLLGAALAVLAGWQLADRPFLHNADHALSELYFELTPTSRDFDSVIVGIDTASLRADPDWPWPRDRYAKVLRELEAAGAARVAFDIDFSTRRENDDEFRDAIREAGIPVYLASFRQPYENMPEVVAEVRPHAALAEHARVVSTTFPVDADGVVRAMSAYEPFSDGPVPNLALALEGHAPFSGLRGVDFAQDLDALPVIPFTDVLAGHVPASVFAGRTVFVGATAPELGDAFALPLLGLRSGVALNALAYETLRRDAEKSVAPDVMMLLLIAVAAAAALQPVSQVGIRAYAALGLFVFTTIFLLGLAYQAWADTLLPTAPALLIQAFCTALMLCVAADRYAAQLFRSRMEKRGQAAVLEAMMKGNHDGILLASRSGRIERCNERAAELLGTTDVLRQDALLKDAAPALCTLSADEPPRLLELKHTDGDRRHVEASIIDVEIPLGRSRYERRRVLRHVTVYTLHDMTAQKQAEDLERKAKDMHAEASAAKSTLISTMGHELRTPLNAVCGFSEMIADEAFGEHSSPEYAEFGRLIRSSGNQLLGVVNDMLLAGRLQTSGLEPKAQRFTFGEAASAALDRARDRQAWTDPDIVIRGEAEALDAEYDLIVTLLYHLIDNASKFGGGSGTVTITAERAEALRIRVEDEGPGLAGADPEKLTQLFEQGDGSKSRSYEGCGLGLFLVERIALLHGGTLVLRDREGGGCAAEVSLASAEAVTAPPALVA
ncbi:CHASE2 domain-containing protein [Parvularcula oceani]|uniref:CHASE2 domain-containing protein n=1 Tax=Parvularcula oceani TaxID=1247963 RepID=UPI00138E280F|nr:CHASE2 domain-containing protein [Parvularcula oceani]